MELLVFFIIVAICITIYSICYIKWCKSHRRPLTDSEIRRLSEIRKKRELKRLNKLVGNFETKYKYQKNSNLNPNGAFSSCDIESYVFPSYIASQLFGKKHEWIVLGLVKEGIVIKYWANKGVDRRGVSLQTSLDNIIQECKRLRCTAILDLHNHPNANPNKYNCLTASNSDIKASNTWFSKLNKNGISLYSFVCERGNWMLYYRKNTEYLQYIPEFTTIAYIAKQNNISEDQNLKLHKEIGIFHR